MEDEVSNPREQHLLSQLKIDTGVSVDRTNKTALLLEAELQKSGGMIPYSEVMKYSLYGSEGYYNAGKVEIGEGKDFITHPEMSEFFGLSVGLAAKRVWEAMGEPESFSIIEMGAGQGSLAYGMLKWLRELHPDFYKSIRYKILEYGQELIPRQRERLNALNDPNKVNWIRGSAFDLPVSGIKGVFISNELVDAFPVERVMRINGKIKQKFVTIENGRWVELWEEPSAEVLDHITKHSLVLPDGVEEAVNLNAEKFQKKINAGLDQGAVITIDYGDKKEPTDKDLLSIRYYKKFDDKRAIRGAVTEETMFSEYRHMGDVDITSDVNFQVLEDTALSDGLKIAFSGDEADLHRAMDIGFVLRGIKTDYFYDGKFRKNFDSWNTLVDFAKGYYNMAAIRARAFYANLMVRNIDPSSLDIPEKSGYIVTFPLELPIYLGDQYKDQTVIVDFSNTPEYDYYLEWHIADQNYCSAAKWNKDKAKYLVQVNEEGEIPISPELVKNAKITTVDGEMIKDLSKEEELKKVIEELGFDYSQERSK